MKKHIIEFLRSKSCTAEKIYNECSFQYELGKFLQGKLEGKKVQYERHVKEFHGFNPENFTPKKVVDISIFTGNSPSTYKSLDCVIELKFPKNGKVPETFFDFCKDIVFLEQLQRAGFKEAYFVAIVEDDTYYQGGGNRRTDGIYAFFRNGKKNIEITGVIEKPTGKNRENFSLPEIEHKYLVNWKDIIPNGSEGIPNGSEGRKYLLISIKEN